MPKLINQIFFLFFLSFHSLLTTSQSHPSSSSPNAFINAECAATHYPTLCIQCLSNYSSTIQQNHLYLAQAALSFSLSRAQSAATFVSRLAKLRGIKPTEYQALQDCTQNMAGSVDELSRSLKELQGMDRRRVGVTGRQDFGWHVGNAQTWVSSALTYQNMCLGAFGGGSSMVEGKLKVAMTTRVGECVQVTSNALALVNRFAARHA